MKPLKKLIALSMAGLLVFPVSNVFAEEYTTSAKGTLAINPGNLNIGAVTPPDFGAVTLNGTDQTIGSTLGTVEVSDSTGTGDGWHFTVQATAFAEVAPDGTWDGVGETGTRLTMPENSLSLDAPSSITQVDTTSPVPVVLPGASWNIDKASATTILSAAADTGMGKYNITFDPGSLSLTIPANAKLIDSVNYAGVPTPYESTLTFTIITGP